MGRHANRTQIYVNGRRARAVAEAEALILADRQTVIERAIERARSNTRGQLMRKDMELNAGLRGPRRRWNPESRRDIVLIGNAVDAAITRVEEWPHAHDRRAVTVMAGGAVWIPNETQAARRGRKLSRAAASA